MITTDGLNGPLWIGDKLLTYSKPIIGNGTHYELVGWTSKDWSLPSSHSSPTKVKGQKNQVICMCKQILN